MTFSSPYFWLFLISTLALHHLTPERWRWLLLLGASYLFYWWQAPYLPLVLAAITAISYLCGIGMLNTDSGFRRGSLFWGGVSSCILLLALLKYGSAGLLPGTSALQTMVTIGVSYYTFQALSYLIDIRLGLLPPEQHLGYYALSLAFFPKLLQGPIERGNDLLPQLRTGKPFDYLAVRSGLLLVAWGLFQKVVIADRLGMYVDTVYNNLHAYQGLPLLVATYGYAGQIYFDFAGYTSMAIGSARLFGINLTANFNQPYLATSIADFWRRWHISFSRWILDYIFKPLQLGWRDWGATGTALALLITFVVSGLWHGASWNFVIWGMLHGIYMACSVWYRPWQKKLHNWLGVSKKPLLKLWQIGITFQLVCLAWVFFRANSLDDALYVLQHLWPLQTEPLQGLLMIKGDRELYITTLLLGGLMTTVLFPSLKHGIHTLFTGRWRWAAYYLLVLIILVCGIFHQGAFLYGRF